MFGRHVCATAHAWKAEDNSVEPLLPFYIYMVSWLVLLGSPEKREHELRRSLPKTGPQASPWSVFSIDD